VQVDEYCHMYLYENAEFGGWHLGVPSGCKNSRNCHFTGHNDHYSSLKCFCQKGIWSSWSVGSCSAQCGNTGRRTKSRSCSNGVCVKLNGLTGTYETVEEDCNRIDCAPTAWDTSACVSLQCGGEFSGKKFRSQVTAAGTTIPQESVCAEQACEWAGWGQWSECSKTCGGGSQTRVSTCNGPKCKVAANNYSHQRTETQTCNEHRCECDSKLDCNGHGTPTSPFFNPESGCECACEEGWETSNDVSGTEAKCNKPSFCHSSCYDITVESQCGYTAEYAKFGLECKDGNSKADDDSCCEVCYWHDDLIGCLHKGEYILSYATKFDIDPTKINLESASSTTKLYTSKFTNMNVGPLTIPHVGHEYDVVEFTKITKESATVSADGIKSSYTDFESTMEKNMEQQEETRTKEQKQWKSKQTRNLVSATVSAEACMGAKATGQGCVKSSLTAERETKTENGKSLGTINTDHNVLQKENTYNHHSKQVGDNWSSYNDKERELEDLSYRTTTKKKCFLEKITVQPLHSVEVQVALTVGTVELPVNQILELQTNYHKKFELDFGGTMQTTAVSDCVSNVVSAPVMETAECDVVQNAAQSFLAKNMISFLPKCAIPTSKYEVYQNTYDSQWCTDINGHRDESTTDRFALGDPEYYIANNVVVPNFEDPDFYPMDCSEFLSSTNMCLDTVDIQMSSVNVAASYEFSLKEHAYSYLVENFDDVITAAGWQHLIKLDIPARHQVLLEVQSADYKNAVDVQLVARFGNQCPGFKHNPKEEYPVVGEGSDEIMISNSDYDTMRVYVVVQTNARKESDFITNVRYVEVPNTNVECEETQAWWTKNKYDIGCEFYESGDRQKFCAFDSATDGENTYTGAQICPSCGFCKRSWREECPDAPDWACSCDNKVKDCDGVCGGKNGICVEECPWAYGIPGAINEKTEEDQRRQLIVGGGEAEIHEYPWFAHVGGLGDKEWTDGVQGMFTAMEDDKIFFPVCGCTIIGRSACMSAAHCFYNNLNQLRELELTHVSFMHGKMITEVRAVHIHPQFNPRLLRRGHDVAIVQFDPLPCDVPGLGALELLADGFDFDGCTAFVEGAGRQVGDWVTSEPTEPVTAEPTEPVTDEPTIFEDPCAQLYEEYGDDYEYGEDYEEDDPTKMDLMIKCGFASRGTRDPEKYPEVGVLNEYITKVWSHETCDTFTEMSPISYFQKNNYNLPDFSVCTFSGDSESHFQNPELICDGDSGSCMKIDIDPNPESHHYVCAGIVSYSGRGCSEYNIPIYHKPAAAKNFIQTVYPNAQFVQPQQCDRDHYQEGTGVQVDVDGMAGKQDVWECELTRGKRYPLTVWTPDMEEEEYATLAAENVGIETLPSELARWELAEIVTTGDKRGQRRACVNLDADALAGKIALIERGGCPYGKKIRKVFEAGAIGLVMYNHLEEGDFTIEVPSRATESLAEIVTGPISSVTKATGEHLKQLIADGTTQVHYPCYH